MKKRLIGMAMAAILAMTALTGCGTAEDTSSLDSLTSPMSPHSLNLPSIVEKEEGIFTTSLCGIDGIECEIMQEITSVAPDQDHRHWQPEMCRCCMPDLAQPTVISFSRK